MNSVLFLFLNDLSRSSDFSLSLSGVRLANGKRFPAYDTSLPVGTNGCVFVDLSTNLSYASALSIHCILTRSKENIVSRTP